MARKFICPSGKVAYVTNVMKDGTVRDSMDGVVIRDIPENKEILDTFYAVMRNIIHRQQQERAAAEAAAETDESNGIDF